MAARDSTGACELPRVGRDCSKVALPHALPSSGPPGLAVVATHAYHAPSLCHPPGSGISKFNMDANSLIIRRGILEDVPTLVEFNIAMARETENKTLDRLTVQRGVRAMFDGRGDGFYLVAQVAGSDSRVVGALMVTYEWSDWRNAWFWWLQSVYVHPDYRRRGVFRSLYQALQQEAESRSDVCGLRLYVERENDNAQQTYQALAMNESPYFLYESEFE